MPKKVRKKVDDNFWPFGRIVIVTEFCAINPEKQIWKKSPEILIFKLATDDSQEVHKMQKYARCEKLVRKKRAHETMRKLTTRVSRFDYFLVQFNFTPYRTRQPLCLVHNFRLYHETAWDITLEKSASWSSINNTK